MDRKIDISQVVDLTGVSGVMSKEKQTLLWLLVGNIVYAAVVSILGAFFLHDRVRFILGVFLSSIGSCIVAIHLYFSLQKSLDLSEEEAAKRETGQAMIRMLIMIAVVVTGLVCSRWFHPLGVVLGAFSMKASAYIQSFFHKE